MTKGNLGLIGRGFVGTAFYEGMKHAFNIWSYDKKLGPWFPSQIAGSLEDPIKAIVDNCDVIFVCVPTPMKSNGECDTSIVEDVVQKIHDCAVVAKGQRVVVIKSTVVPGTTQKLNEQYGNFVQCVFNPEFLREATYIDDFKNQDRIIIGGPRPASTVVKDIYQHAYPNAPTVKTNETTAEMVKYVTNCFLSVKVAFANEMSEICNKLDVDFDKVVEYATKDKRLGDSHWSVPGPMLADDGSGLLLKGFGGSCFVKDINALIFLAKGLGIDPKVMNGAWQKNLEVRPEKDWENLKGRAIIG